MSDRTEPADYQLARYDVALDHGVLITDDGPTKRLVYLRFHDHDTGIDFEVALEAGLHLAGFVHHLLDENAASLTCPGADRHERRN